MSWKNVRVRWTKCLKLTGEKTIEKRKRERENQIKTQHWPLKSITQCTSTNIGIEFEQNPLHKTTANA